MLGGDDRMRCMRSGVIGRWVLCMAMVGALVSGIASARTRPPAAVVVFPSPGTGFNQPRAQISFRGIPASEIGRPLVVGSRSGVHAGVIEASSEGDGGSFLPAKPFLP